jgi:hypothetical protein
MMTSVLRPLAALGLAIGLACLSSVAFAQPADPKAGDKPRPPAAEAPKDAGKDAAKDAATRKADELAETAKIMPGPAGNPECVWLGRRVVGLLYRDDLDTAFRHLDLYDRFGCPGGHIQATFRCVVRQGSQIDLKAPESLNARVHGCWINPASPPAPAAAANPAAASGTSTQ